MDDRLSRVESALGQLQSTVATLERRVAAQERQLAAAAAASDPGWAPAAEPLDSGESTIAPREHASQLVVLLSLLGRTFVVLGGAFLLRALSDNSVVPVHGGIALGLAYAAFWLAAGDRAAAAGRALSAGFHVGTSGAIALPIVVEATTRFAVFGPRTAAAAVGVVAAAGIGIAVRRRQQALAWIAAIPALAVVVTLVVATGTVVPFAVVALLIGLATLWIGYTLDWTLLRWQAALVADLLAVSLSIRAAAGTGMETAAALLGVQLSLVTGYLASIAVRTIVRRRDVNVFEILQATTALAIGFGGALYTARETASGTAAVAIASLLIGVACYGVAFAFVARQQGVRRNFYFYTSCGLALVIVANGVLLAAPARALVWSALALATALLARRAGRRSLEVHAAVYTVAAAAGGGLLSSATSAMLWSADGGPATPATAAAVLAVAVAVWIVRAPPMRGSLPASIAGLVLVALVCWSTCGVLVDVARTALAANGAAANPGLVATARTTALGGAAVALAWIGRHDRYREAGWLVYPVVLATGLKILVEDVPRSNPSALFVALAVYGLVLITAPRLRQSRPSER